MIRDNHIWIKNIYYMLAYAFDSLTPSVYQDMEVEQFQYIHNMFAHILSRRLEMQLKKGLYKTYEGKIEETSAVRGKLYMPGTIRSRMQRRCTVSCEVDELSENNLLNQIIKTTIYLLLKSPDVEEKYRAELKREMMYFSNVERLTPWRIRWKNVHLQRQSSNYRLMLSVCRLILEGMLLTTESGAHRLFSLQEIPNLLKRLPDQDTMDALYERFVRNYYARESRQFPGFSVRAETMKWQEDCGKDQYLPKMRTDITLTYEGKVLIIDTKYYQNVLTQRNDRSILAPDNLYQIFAYVKNKETYLKRKTGSGEVSGMLLYAATDEAVLPDNTYWLMGSKISVITLDLNRDFKEICGQLDQIVEDYFGISLHKK